MKNKIKLSIMTVAVIINLCIETALGQSTTSNNNYSSTSYLGWNTVNDLLFRIGTGATAPLLMILKSNGDLNLTNAATSPSDQNAYKIGGNNILWHKGDITNIFVGVGAGTSNTTFATGNTFVGYYAGNTNLDGDENTFIGSLAGYGNTYGWSNTFVGRCSGKFNNQGVDNTFVGHWAGSANRDLSGNTVMGVYALFNQDSSASTPSNTPTAYNDAFGTYALHRTKGGIENASFGAYAGYANTTGNDNILWGTMQEKQIPPDRIILF